MATLETVKRKHREEAADRELTGGQDTSLPGPASLDSTLVRHPEPCRTPPLCMLRGGRGFHTQTRQIDLYDFAGGNQPVWQLMKIKSFIATSTASRVPGAVKTLMMIPSQHCDMPSSTSLAGSLVALTCYTVDKWYVTLNADRGGQCAAPKPALRSTASTLPWQIHQSSWFACCMSATQQPPLELSASWQRNHSGCSRPHVLSPPCKVQLTKGDPFNGRTKPACLPAVNCHCCPQLFCRLGTAPTTVSNLASECCIKVCP
eukprot:1483882-Rhodomonas_salina.3